ncbi:MAG: dephospho-CoA kinase [Oscillospiraceae bacterium]|nr:dephospho-CoA kinase [Oscillospiraceae bacterium]
MKIIGITGGTGSGKTTALFVLHELGARIVDCDGLYHDLLDSSREMIEAIGEHFPGTVTDGKLDRKKLGRCVFRDEEKLRELNDVTHPFVVREVLADIEREKKAGRDLYAIDAIALIESGLADMCDIVVGVTAPVQQRVRRLMDREGISEAYALMRIKAQHGDEYYRERCDTVLENDGDREAFEHKCRQYFLSMIGR